MTENGTRERPRTGGAVTGPAPREGVSEAPRRQTTDLTGDSHAARLNTAARTAVRQTDATLMRPTHPEAR